MQIIIAGCGKLGSILAHSLIEEQHNLTLIDIDGDVLDKCSDALDALTVKGSCVNVSTLEEADIAHCDIFICTTKNDETNMLGCLIAKKKGAQYTVARIRDPQYLQSMNFVMKELNIDYVANPERATAREIGRMLRLPFANSIETFSRGQVELVEVRVNGDEPFVDMPLKNVYVKSRNMPRVLFCAVERDGVAQIPRGDFIIKPGDRLFAAAEASTITAFFRYLGRNTKAAKDALIVGGSRTAFYLCQLLGETDVKTKLIEKNPERSIWLNEMLPKTTVICGDGTDQDLLLSEGLENADAFIAMTDRDEENLMSGLYATTVSKGHVIVKSTHVNYSRLLAGTGLNSVINPTQIACNIIVKAVRSVSNAKAYSSIDRMYRMMEGKAEALEFIVSDDSAPYLNKPLSQLTIVPDALVAVIVRDNKVKVPFGDDIIQSGDHVVIFTKLTGIADLGDIIKSENE